MFQILKTKVNLSFVINPFYLYCIAFFIAILVYMFGWSTLFPPLSPGLILFMIVTFILFIPAGLYLARKGIITGNKSIQDSYFSEILFGIIILLGALNVLYMGYLPIADRSHNYREFGMPVVDPLFNTLSIFFEIIIFHSYLKSHKKRFLVFFFLILLIQILLYRRSTIIWILMSSSFLYILYIRKIKLLLILGGIILLPLLSFCFGIYGNTRSKLSETFVLNDLGASGRFKKTGFSYNHYMTYLYISSPLANLQKNIDAGKPGLKNGDIKDFIFYCLIPESITLRLEKSLRISQPDCYLISPNLIVGTFYMVAFYTLGWSGMIIMYVSLIFFVLICLYIINRYNAFALEVYSLLSAFMCMLIFSNFMNRLDVILMLFIYPVLFHIITERSMGSSTRLKIVRE